jgi:hypothetical protein
MTFQPLPGFKSLTTHHCFTGSMRHIYEFHDYPVSEDLLLGLGAGVGFVYWHVKGTLPFYGGRTNVGRPGEEGLAKTAGRRTGVRVESFQTGSAQRAEKALLDMLEAGEPVMIHVDMGFLPYFDFGDHEYHFGRHIVIVAGYDPQIRQVLIADRDEELHPVSLEDLAQARGSKFKPFPPRHTWYIFDFSGKRPPQPEEVRQAIRQVTIGMLEPPITNLGVKGIRKAARRTIEWPKIMDKEQLRSACFNVFIMIDAEGGTGGGLFRYMYSRFLREAAEITGDDRLMVVADEFQSIGDRWQMIAETFKRASKAPDPASVLSECVAPLNALADQEEAAWSQLHELVQ